MDCKSKLADMKQKGCGVWGMRSSRNKYPGGSSDSERPEGMAQSTGERRGTTEDKRGT
jgi:hypothetical protein